MNLVRVAGVHQPPAEGQQSRGRPPQVVGCLAEDAVNKQDQGGRPDRLLAALGQAITPINSGTTLEGGPPAVELLPEAVRVEG